MDASTFRRSWRTVFISDLHLGAQGCQAELLLDFLSAVRCETLYLVGDVVDAWRLAERWRWPATHDAVVRRLLALAHSGSKVVYVPGNHDAFARSFYGVHLAGVNVAPEAVHEGADGRRWLVTHGDLYDGVPGWGGWATAGDMAYRALLSGNTLINAARRSAGLGYWNFAGRLKGRSRRAAQAVDRFERALAAAARRRGLDGVICGHIHSPALRQIDGVTYCNDGDWVESCTAACERSDGVIELVDWAAVGGDIPHGRRLRPTCPPAFVGGLAAAG